MESEFSLTRTLLADARERSFGTRTGLVGTLGDKQIALLKTGIGKVNAASTAWNLLSQWQPDAVVNTGVAGGIDRSLSVGDIVVGATTCYHDFYAGEVSDHLKELGFPDLLPAHPALLASLEQASQHMEGIRLGQICTGDQFVTDNDTLLAIKRKRPEGLAVDMESNAVAHVCFQQGVPFVSFRIVSDTPWVDNQAEQYARFWTEAPQKNFQLLETLIESL